MIQSTDMLELETISRKSIRFTEPAAIFVAAIEAAAAQHFPEAEIVYTRLIIDEDLLGRIVTKNDSEEIEHFRFGIREGKWQRIS